MTRSFSKWSTKQKFAEDALADAMDEVADGIYEASIGGSLYKKRIAFEGRGKSGSARTILCMKKGDRSIYVHGFAKNEKNNLSKKELKAFKVLAKILLDLTEDELETAIRNRDLIEV